MKIEKSLLYKIFGFFSMNDINSISEKVLEDSEKLIKKIDFPQDHKYEIIFNLLAVKYGVIRAFSWSVPTFPNEDEYEKYGANHWTDFDMQIGDHDSVWMKDFKEIVESCNLSIELLKMNSSKEFDYDTFLDENPVPATIGDIDVPEPKIEPITKIPASKIEEFENQFSPDYNDCEPTCSHSRISKSFWISTKNNLENLQKNSVSMKESERKEFSGQPKCCLFWFIQRDTEILCDTITEFYGTTFDFSDKALKHYVIHNFWSHDNFNHAERMSRLNNRKDMTNQKFPLLWFPVCDRCLNDSGSPAEILHNKLEEFSKKLSPEIYNFIKKRGIRGHYF